LLQEFIDVFTWNYKELKGIPLHIVEHKIELEITNPPSHQVHYCMNPNYVTIVKQDLDKLLAIRFIKSMEQVIWLSPIVVVLKNNNKLPICIDFWKLNIVTKKDPYPLPLMSMMFWTRY
jgi:hypothetical protein